MTWLPAVQRASFRALGLTACACALVFVLPAAAADAAAPVLEVASELGRTARGDRVSPPPKVRPMRWSRMSARTLESQSPFDGRRLIVGLERARGAAAVARDYGVELELRYPPLKAIQVRGRRAALDRLLAGVGTDVRLRYAEPLRERRHVRLPDDPYVRRIDFSTGVPFQWAFSNGGVGNALNLSGGRSDIVVGVVDTGYAPIADLEGKVVDALFFPDQNSDAIDTHGHGTAVASLIAANHDDGRGLAGFGGSTRLIVFRETSLKSFRTAAAIRELVDRGVRIINISRGGPTFSFVEADAVRYALSRGVLVVAAAGNSGSTAPFFPGHLVQPDGGGRSYGLLVGASNTSGVRAAFSNFGSRLSLLAPGAYWESDCRFGIFAALSPAVIDRCGISFVDPTNNTRYGYVMGTSFAAPQVSGVAALVWAARPELTNHEVASIVKESARRPAEVDWTRETGWGVLDGAGALELATGASSADRLSIVEADVAPRAWWIVGFGGPVAGQRFAAGVRAAYEDGTALESGELSCAAAIGSTPLRVVRAYFYLGYAVCGWKIPASAAGEWMDAAVVVGDGAATARRNFSVKIKPEAAGASP